MDLSSAIDWWDEWKLRILVLCSLFLQSFLYFSAYVRMLYSLRCLRVLVWLAYIGGDALAIYALATLFNRQKQPTTVDGGSVIEVIWAPVLLIHLGGQELISAYSLEDNELWRRHVITLASQVTVALYVFCKWWSGEKRLLKAAIFFFIVGIFKFSQKPWALWRASYATITSTYLSSPSRRAEDESSSLWRLLGRCCTTFCTGDFRDGFRGQFGEENSEVNHIDNLLRFGCSNSLTEYVQQAQCLCAPWKEQEKDEDFVFKNIYKMFVDVSAPYSVRLHYLQYFINLGKKNQHKKVRALINMQFSAIYTRARSWTTYISLCTIYPVISLDIASVVLFAKSDMEGYNKSDITVTYILLFGTFAIEMAPFFHALFLLLLLLCPSTQPLRWQDMVAQHNIMSFCARKKKPPTLMKLATFSYLRDYINRHWYIQHQCVAEQISMLVRQHAEEDGWKEYIYDAATYKRFNNLRGEHTLMKMNHHLLLLEQGKLEWTWIFNRPFDEYVLLWHIATDLCLHHTSSSTTNNTSTSSSSQSQDSIKSRRSSSEIISNYMIYLLFICPDMLIPGTRSDLFMLASDEIKSMINASPLPLPDETRSGIAKWILGIEHGDQCMAMAPNISNARKLARVLIDSLNTEQRWEVIQGVWVEMLCYSASRCRGYLHAKSLGVAGEFLTNVWLLWWCMGMQTLPDMMHNVGPPEELTAAASI